LEQTTRDDRLRSLGGEVLGDERCVRRRLRDICRRRASFFVDLGEQPGLNRGGRTLLLRMIVGETAGLEDYGAQLGDAAATRVIKLHKRKTGPGHRILQERDRRCPRQAMLAAQMQKSTDKAVAAVSVIITAARPVAVVGKILEHQVEQLHPLCDLAFWHWFECSRSGQRTHSSTRCRSPSGKAMKVTFAFRVAVLRSCSPRENVFDALGRKVELNESDAAIEGFAVMRDQPIPKTKAAHAFEKDGEPGGFWQ